MQAVNIGYSPRHAAPPSAKRPKLNSRWRRARLVVLLIVAFALLAAGVGVAIRSTASRRAAACHRTLTCGGLDEEAGRSLTVLIDSAASFGLHGPSAIAYCRGHLWVTNQVSDSVTEFGWQAGSKPTIWSGRRYELAAPVAAAAGRDRLWIASATAITEISAISGQVMHVISPQPGFGNPRALTLYGRKLWVAEAGSVAEFDTATGRLIHRFQARRYGFSDARAVAVSNGRLWVVNAGNGSVTELDATTGRLVGRLSGAALGQGQPVTAVADSSRLWIAGIAPAAVSEIDTSTGRLVTRIAGAKYAIAGPTAITLSRGKVWVANAGDNSVTEIDAATGALAGVLHGPRYGFAAPIGIVAYRGRVWVVNHATSTVTELIPHG